MKYKPPTYETSTVTEEEDIGVQSTRSFIYNKNVGLALSYMSNDGKRY